MPSQAGVKIPVSPVTAMPTSLCFNAPTSYRMIRLNRINDFYHVKHKLIGGNQSPLYNLSILIIDNYCLGKIDFKQKCQELTE